MFWVNWVSNQTLLWSSCPSSKRTTKAQSTAMSSSLSARKWVELGASTWMAARAPLWMTDTLKLTAHGPLASHSVCMVLSLQRRRRGPVSVVYINSVHCFQFYDQQFKCNQSFPVNVFIQMQQLSSKLQKSWGNLQPVWSTVLWLRLHRTWGGTFWLPTLM